MSMNALHVLGIVLPRVPVLVKTAILHALGLSDPSKYMDLRSNLIITFVRSFINPTSPKTVLEVQKSSMRDPGVKGNAWVSDYTAPPPPETSVRDALIQAIHDMLEPDQPVPQFKVPDIAPVEAEWIGHRAGHAPGEPPSDLSATEKYTQMMKETTKPTTILYMHGGAYYLMDPATHRIPLRKLAKRTGGRCYAIRYRLAPQNPFPAALLDALMSYLTLLYPPPDAYHDPVKPENIVFSGDSAGGNLSLALLQLLLQFQRTNTTIHWHGEERKVPLPAGVATNSPWLDVTESLPSWRGEETPIWDYLPLPDARSKVGTKPCSIWPAHPPRKLLYVEDDIALHPLVSLLLSRSWEGSPPMYICTGWEIIGLEDKIFAQKLHKDGVPLIFEEYEAMPHCFAMVLPGSDVSNRCMDRWSGFISKAVADPGSVQSSSTYIKMPSLKEVSAPWDGLTDVTEQDIQRWAAGWQNLPHHITPKL